MPDKPEIDAMELPDKSTILASVKSPKGSAFVMALFSKLTYARFVNRPTAVKSLTAGVVISLAGRSSSKPGIGSYCTCIFAKPVVWK